VDGRRLVLSPGVPAGGCHDRLCFQPGHVRAAPGLARRGYAAHRSGHGPGGGSLSFSLSLTPRMAALCVRLRRSLAAGERDGAADRREHSGDGLVSLLPSGAGDLPFVRRLNGSGSDGIALRLDAPHRSDADGHLATAALHRGAIRLVFRFPTFQSKGSL